MRGSSKEVTEIVLQRFTFIHDFSVIIWSLSGLPCKTSSRNRVHFKSKDVQFVLPRVLSRDNALTTEHCEIYRKKVVKCELTFYRELSSKISFASRFSFIVTVSLLLSINIIVRVWLCNARSSWVKYILRVRVLWRRVASLRRMFLRPFSALQREWKRLTIKFDDLSGKKFRSIMIIFDCKIL